MANLPIRGLITRVARDAYTTYMPGGTRVKTLPMGSGFQINNTYRYDGQVWIQSGLGHWYRYSDDFLSCNGTECGQNRDRSRVMVFPATPWGGSAGSAANNWDLVGWAKLFSGEWALMHNWGHMLNHPPQS